MSTKWKADRVFVQVGEQPPFLSKSKACYARFMEALLKTGSHLEGAFSLGPWDERGDFLASLIVPVSKVAEFQTIAKCTLEYHPNIQLGMQIMPSVKWEDREGHRYHEPHPDFPLYTHKRG
jgi:hypothetical protein